MLVTCINGQGLDSSIVSNVIGGRYHRVLLRICWRQVVHLQRGDLGKVSDDLLILLTVLDTGYYKWSGYYQTFLLEKVAARQLALTERLVLILDLGREEGC